MVGQIRQPDALAYPASCHPGIMSSCHCHRVNLAAFWRFLRAGFLGPVGRELTASPGRNRGQRHFYFVGLLLLFRSLL
jgi:hypothetical protein